MKRVALWIAVGGVMLGIGALLFAWSGVYNVSASSGHFKITAWFLHFTMRSSVRTHALGIEVPPLGDITQVQRGAGHYLTGCEPCHGGPGAERDQVLVGMVPPPPFLMSHIDEWRTRELFWLVKHGLKYTAMPQWVAQSRDDEAWDMTSFLLRLPDLTPEEYRRLTLGEQASTPEQDNAPFSADAPRTNVAKALAECSRCHGRDGAGRGTGAFPRLDGQKEAYLFESLQAFARGQRHSGFMQPVAERLTETEMRALAKHYASVTAPVPDSAQEQNAEHVRRGASIAAQGVPEAGIPPCAVCHGPGGGPHNAVYPSLAGQHASYIAKQLRLFRNGARGGTAYAPIMEAAAKHLEDAQIEAVAAYFASLPRRAPPERADATR